jgi:hypothetical protein
MFRYDLKDRRETWNGGLLMAEDVDRAAEASANRELAVGVRVRVRPGQSTETSGTVVEDFGDDVGIPVDIGTTHISDPARRWAIMLDTGGLEFLDSEHLSVE